MEKYKDKTISVMGDSISTFEGYIPKADGTNLNHRKRYPQENLLTDVKETWWMRIIDRLGARLGINESWAGSTVGNVIDGNVGDQGEDAAMASLTRIKNLGSNGMPELIMFYGGTNDLGRRLVPIGDTDDANLYQLDLEKTKWGTLLRAYAAAIMRMKYFYPTAEIAVIFPGYTYKAYSREDVDLLNAKLEVVCKRLDVKFVDLRECGITPENAAEYLPDKLHPNAEGMRLIADCIMKTVLNAECGKV